MTASLVQELPVLISKSLNISVDDVVVLTITQGNNNLTETNMRKRSDSDSQSGIIVSMTVPASSVENLKQLVQTPDSTLYSPSNGQLPTFIDRSYPVTKASKFIINYFSNLFY